MCEDLRSERILAEDWYGTVEYAMRASGKMEAKEWLENQSDLIQYKFATMFDHHMATGKLTENKLKKISGVPHVYEYRVPGHRLFCFKRDSRWLLTHHFGKANSKRAQTKSAQKSVTIAEEHFEREATE